MPWLLLSLLLAYVISPDWKYIVHALNYYTFRKDKQMTDMAQNQRKKDKEKNLIKIGLLKKINFLNSEYTFVC